MKQQVTETRMETPRRMALEMPTARGMRRVSMAEEARGGGASALGDKGRGRVEGKWSPGRKAQAGEDSGPKRSGLYSPSGYGYTVTMLDFAEAA